MTKIAMENKANFENQSESLPPYAPSWVDRLLAWMDQLPGPSWLYSIGIWVFFFLLPSVLLWVEGIYPIGTFVPSYAFLAGMLPFFLGLFSYLDSRAGAALSTLREALKTSEREYNELYYRLTTLPVRPTLWASLLGLVITGLITLLFGAPSSFNAFGDSLMAGAFIYGVSICVWWLFGTLIYHTIHQLQVIHLIYTEYTHINLFHLSPLYAFSNVTALTAVSLTAGIYGWYAFNPETFSDPLSLGVAFLVTILALVTFAWPLLGVHRLLVVEKERLLDEVSSRFETVAAELHRRVDSGNLKEMDEVNNTLAGLERERNAIKRIPTWPWQPETVRWLITALISPLALWIFQYVLQRLLAL